MKMGVPMTKHAGAAVIQQRIVKYDGAGKVVQAAAAADLSIGVSDTGGDVVADQRIDVHVYGQPEVSAGGAIAFGASVTSDANGKAVTAATGEIAVGWAVEAADAENDLIAVQLGRHTAA